MAVLSFWSDTAADALWNHVFELDPLEMREMREKQKMALARYGKQSLLQWADVEVREIARWYNLLAEMVAAENEIQRGTED